MLSGVERIPALRLEQGFCVDKGNNYRFGALRFALLESLHTWATLNEDGEIVSMTPRHTQGRDHYPLKMNLGSCVRAGRLFDMSIFIRERPSPTDASAGPARSSSQYWSTVSTTT